MNLLSPGTRMQRAEAASRSFERHYNRSPTSVGWAPGRVNLIGEHTDYNHGLALPLALPYATFVAAASRNDSRVRIVSEQEPTRWEGQVDRTGPGHVSGWPSYVAGVLWALRLAGIPLPGLDLAVDSSVPVGAGLSSSAALSCATALAVTEVAGLELTTELRDRLVSVCIRAETEVAGAPTGGLDQTAVLHARAGHALLLDFADGHPPAAQHLRLPLSEDGFALLVVDTRVAHTLNDGGFAARRADCDAAAAALGHDSLRTVALEDLERLPDERLRRRAHHVVTENQRVQDVVGAFRERDYVGVGRTLLEGHQSLRKDFEVSCLELDTVVAAAMGAGALGARMTGGGFGGSAVVLVRAEDSEHVGAAIETAFIAADHRRPQLLVVTPSSGGGRLPL